MPMMGWSFTHTDTHTHTPHACTHAHAHPHPHPHLSTPARTPPQPSPHIHPHTHAKATTQAPAKKLYHSLCRPPKAKSTEHGILIAPAYLVRAAVLRVAGARTCCCFVCNACFTKQHSLPTLPHPKRKHKHTQPHLHVILYLTCPHPIMRNQHRSTPQW
jgi:hypothetical protein